MKRTEEIRDEVLLQLVAGFPAGQPLERLHKQATRAGFNYSVEELRTGAFYLAGLNPPLARIERDNSTNQEKFAATSAGVAHRENA